MPVCIAQALEAAFADLKAAVEEYDNPVEVVPAPTKFKAAAPIAPTALHAALPALPAMTKAELAAKEKTIKSKDAALESKEEELKTMKAQLDSKEVQLTKARDDQKDSMEAIIEGAKAQGACMHLHLHWCPTIHQTIICFHASRNRSCRSTGGRACQLAPAGHDVHQRRPLEQHPLGC